MCLVNICDESLLKTLKTGDIDCSAAVLQVCLRQRLVFIDLQQWIMQCGAGAGVGGLNCSYCSLSPPVLLCCSAAVWDQLVPTVQTVKRLSQLFVTEEHSW